MRERMRLGLTGNTALDFGIGPCVHTFCGREVLLEIDGRVHRFRADKTVTLGCKTTVESLPEFLEAHPFRSRFGGGVYNSSTACRMIDRETPLRYLDAAEPEARLRAVAGDSGIELDFLGLRPMPRNLVIGAQDDKIVLKSPLTLPPTLFDGQHEKLAWLLQCAAILANSVKDRPVMERLLSAAEEHKIRLYCAVTPSLAADYVKHSVLPHVTAAIMSLDEVNTILHLGTGDGIDGALKTCGWAARFVGEGTVFITLGRQGAVAMDTRTGLGCHVRLRSPLLEEVQELVRQNPAAVCGCGDAFAAGVFMSMENGRSLLPSGSRFDSAHTRAARAGCAVALRWLGFDRRLSCEDFIVSDYRWSRGAERPHADAA